MTEIVLASNSPRRRQLLAQTGLNFTVSVADIDESVHENELPADYVLRLAETKARKIASGTKPDRIVLAADTTVVDGRDILGKPADAAEAFAMLTQLRGRKHQVYTGIALLRVSDNFILTDLCVTDVPMRNYSDEEIRAYIATGDPFDKAGAYAIQHAEFHPVETLSGCFASVMGLPLCHVTRLLRKMDVNPSADVPMNCQKYLEYDCPVYENILKN
ncbi:MAG: septum formation protein Maf [Anaerolineae bacterium]|nr:MAG: septum formation protein Maf [Anaerolineae bacterium]WKZ44240.1 MAG: Maf family protein [Anaerolineales bacterium]